MSRIVAVRVPCVHKSEAFHEPNAGGNPVSAGDERRQCLRMNSACKTGRLVKTSVAGWPWSWVARPEWSARLSDGQPGRLDADSAAICICARPLRSSPATAHASTRAWTPVVAGKHHPRPRVSVSEVPGKPREAPSRLPRRRPSLDLDVGPEPVHPGRSAAAGRLRDPNLKRRLVGAPRGDRRARERAGLGLDSRRDQSLAPPLPPRPPVPPRTPAPPAPPRPAFGPAPA